jgi:hypothetical protein
MHNHSWGFIDGSQELIFIQNIKRQVLGQSRRWWISVWPHFNLFT